MGAKLGFKIFVGLLVLVPILTLIMVLGLERSYVEQLNNVQSVSLDRRSSIHESKPKRSPLEQHQELDSPNFDRMNYGLENKRTSNNRAQVFTKKLQVGNDDSMVAGPELYQALKERKIQELRVEKSMRESWWYIREQLSVIKSGNVPTDLSSFITDTMNSMKSHYDALRKWYAQLNTGDNLNWQYWQKNVSIELQALMQKRIHHLQNPTDCASARKLICQVGKTCGFGCQMHHVTYCFILAYASERTLVLESKGWSYNAKGWEAVFQPVTHCTASGSKKSWSMTSTENTVRLSPVDNLSPRPSQLPMSVPKDIVDRIRSFHGFPFSWFVSQFISYLMRPAPSLERYFREKRENIGLNNFDGPIVGLHVRRTDKRSEARYHDISEYMDQVNEWYDWYELVHNEEGGLQRRVYIATDEPSVLTEARTKYPHYEVYSDSGITSLASKTSTRYSQDSLNGVIFDITMLSQCDYIVCTFSSQVCRLAYELMQNLHVDASNMYYSLDDVYYFGGQQVHMVEAIQDHEPPRQTARENELSFKVGDLLGIAGNEKTGYSVGRHSSTRQRGQYPSYKVEEHVLVAEFPSYSNV